MTATEQTELSPSVQAILEVVDDLSKRERQWALDDSEGAGLRPPESFDEATEAAARFLVKLPEIPAGVVAIVTHLAMFCRDWFHFMDGDENFRNYGANTGPAGRTWRNFTEMRSHRERFEAPVIKCRESVELLTNQETPPEAIAKIFGKRDSQGIWSGPFFNHNGRVDEKRIDQQLRHERGEDVPPILRDSDFVEHIEVQEPPLMTATVTICDLAKYLEEKDHEARQAEEPPPGDQGTPQELIEGGAFPHQVKKAFPHLTDAEISRLYRERNNPAT